MLRSDWENREVKEEDLAVSPAEFNAVSSTNSSIASTPVLPDLDLPLADAMKLFEQRYIDAVIARHNGKLSEAAQALGIHRTTLYRRQKAAEK